MLGARRWGYPADRARLVRDLSVMDLVRVTTEYVPVEDRVRLLGESAQGAGVVLWLTQRLLSRVVPGLLAWLQEQAGPGPQADLVQGFAQQAAVAALEPQASVQVAPGSGTVLVETVTIQTGKQSVTLGFSGATPDMVWRLVLEAVPMRQWLGIVHGLYQRAEWPLELWPDWLAESDGMAARDAPMWH
ncbi:MAG: hypothetical protein FGM55_06060 [Rhodoferax sp.]|nr:hypothetical protein [Rhodoferax sp.]